MSKKSKALLKEYATLYKTMEIRTSKLVMIDRVINQIESDQEPYRILEEALDIPWFFIALIHSLESNRDFTKHLHNGDPLTARTVQIPKNRPKEGDPPFTWHDSAMDALKQKKLTRISDWSVPNMLFWLERYNGFGYRKNYPHVLSPYLWSFSNHYSKGKYVADGEFSETAVSKQIGAAVLLRRMEQRKLITLFDFKIDKSFFHMSRHVEPRARDLQRFLNSFEGISLLVDGRPGTQTSEACKLIFGHYLRGDERGEKSNLKES